MDSPPYEGGERGGFKECKMVIRQYLRYMVVAAALVVLFTVCCCIVGCESASGLTESDLVGTNKLDFDDNNGLVGTVIIVLKNDETYEEVFTPMGGKAVRVTGKWDVQEEGTDGMGLNLRKAMIFDYPSQSVPAHPIPKGDYFLSPYITAGNIYLGLDPDHTETYKKLY
jgi:hypothetical protein